MAGNGLEFDDLLDGRAQLHRKNGESLKGDLKLVTSRLVALGHLGETCLGGRLTLKGGHQSAESSLHLGKDAI
jgi:hypothetical protein